MTEQERVYIRNYMRRRRIGKHATPEYVEQILKQQGNKCAICKSVMKKQTLDHHHVTKQLRGVLCNRCNLGIGNFSESIEILEAAREYLISYQQTGK